MYTTVAQPARRGLGRARRGGGLYALILAQCTPVQLLYSWVHGGLAESSGWSGERGAGRRRKTVMLDAGLVEEVKRVANSHGMTLSAYLRAVLSAVIEAESMGVFAPLMLRRMLLYTRLRRADLVLVPLSLLDASTVSREEAVEEGRRLGTLLRSLGVSLEDALELLLENTRILLRERGRYVLLPPRRPGEELLAALAEGLCASYGVSVRSEGGVRVVELEPGEG